ncbi:MAG: hypothetical protein KIH08_07370 [Candidatus Freyarchaeota archaeon]|nr:hypothetical protein [Candidatus Jordarchaeia archaeon]MBS7268895.1 hypothetical protein [Candidatus Jordarchaeia archaeon]MBS7279731.1 hypothetical protein [Candidatus Jordarchaeia archaeon]
MGKHGSLSGEISSEVRNILRGDSRLLEEAKFKRKEKENAIIWTTNIYLKDKSQLSEFVSYIADVVESILERHLASDGEIIRLSVGSGTVSDRGEIWFGIVGGVVFEVYCFTCRSISFVRILHEKQLYGEKNEWVSLDIDEYLDSQWFEE